MAPVITITAEKRTATGKGAARALRRSGKLPAVIYGHGRPPEPLAVSALEFEKALHGIGGSTVIDLAVDGAPTKVLIREIQRHPTRLHITHVDFYEVHAGERLRVDVPLVLVGSPAGVRQTGGVLEQFLREVAIEVLPKDMPERIEVEVTGLEVGRSLHVRDLQVPNARVLDDPEATICTVVPPRVEEVPAVAAAAPELAEPELVRRPRVEEEGEEPGAEETASEE